MGFNRILTKGFMSPQNKRVGVKFLTPHPAEGELVVRSELLKPCLCLLIRLPA